MPDIYSHLITAVIITIVSGIVTYFLWVWFDKEFYQERYSENAALGLSIIILVILLILLFLTFHSEEIFPNLFTKILLFYFFPFVVGYMLGIMAYIIKTHKETYYIKLKLKEKKSEILSKNTAITLNNLTAKLKEISKEVDEATSFLTNEIENRQKALKKLTEKNDLLAKEEFDLNTRVSALKDLPLEVADYFKVLIEEHLKKIEKRKSLHEILMFFFGIFLTTIISITLSIIMK